MVAVGLLAPMAYIFQLFDLFSGERSTLGSSMRVAIMGVGGALSAILMIYGFFDLRKRIPMRRMEERDRELSKAREIVAGEVKRMFTESSRDWTNLVSISLRDSQNKILNEVDSILRTNSNNKNSEFSTNRSEIQKLNAGIDLLQKRVNNIQSLLNRVSNSNSNGQKELNRALGNLKMQEQ
jgi:hypothetical protein